jgi:hypothetical protein
MAEKAPVAAGLKEIVIWIEISNRNSASSKWEGKKFMIGCSEIEFVIFLNGVYVIAGTDIVVLAKRSLREFFRVEVLE